LEVKLLNNHPLEPLIKEYLAEKDITKGSFELYHTILKQYVSYLKEHQILYAKTTDVSNYLDWKKRQGYSPAWLYYQTSVIKGLYQYLSGNHKRLELDMKYTYDIAESIKNVRISNQKPRTYLSIEQAKHLILWTKNNRKYIWHYRDHAMVYLMITTGLRSIEIRRARKKDLRIVNDQLLLYVQGKGRSSADEYVKIPRGVEDAINDYLLRRKDKNPYLFISHSKRSNVPYLSRTFFIRMFRRVLKSSGLDDLEITPHSLRHTAATINLLRGGTLEATRKLMRHSNLQTTMVYAHHVKRSQDDSENRIERYILGEASLIYEGEIIALEF